MNKANVEFEHKFVVDQSFDLAAFHHAVVKLGPLDQYQVAVTDRYYFPSTQPSFIYRHRQDALLNQLSYKSVGSDSQKRIEINLNLSQDTSPSTVDEFMATIGRFDRLDIKKDVRVYYFPEVEIVYYIAKHQAKVVCCVEFEVRNYSNDLEAEKILQEYEQKLGFNAADRTSTSLLELMLR